MTIMKRTKPYPKPKFLGTLLCVFGLALFAPSLWATDDFTQEARDFIAAAPTEREDRRAYYQSQGAQDLVTQVLADEERELSVHERSLLWWFANANYERGTSQHEALIRRANYVGELAQHYWSRDEWREHAFGNPAHLNKLISLQRRLGRDIEFENEYIASLVGLGIVDTSRNHGYEHRFQRYLQTLSTEAAIEVLRAEIRGLLAVDAEDRPEQWEEILANRRGTLAVYQELVD